MFFPFFSFFFFFFFLFVQLSVDQIFEEKKRSFERERERERESERTREREVRNVWTLRYELTYTIHFALNSMLDREMFIR